MQLVPQLKKRLPRRINTLMEEDLNHLKLIFKMILLDWKTSTRRGLSHLVLKRSPSALRVKRDQFFSRMMMPQVTDGNRIAWDTTLLSQHFTLPQRFSASKIADSPNTGQESPMGSSRDFTSGVSIVTLKPNNWQSAFPVWSIGSPYKGICWKCLQSSQKVRCLSMPFVIQIYINMM